MPACSPYGPRRTSRDLGPIDFRDPAAEVLKPYRQYALAHDRVRYVGDPVAAVFASDPYIAEDAASLIGVEIPNCRR